MITKIHTAKLEDMNESESRWYKFVMTTDEDRLSRMTAQKRINNLNFCPVELISNFLSNYNDEDTMKKIDRLNRIFRQASVYCQNQELFGD